MPKQRSSKPDGNVFRTLVGGHALLGNESLLLVVLSICDLLMTYVLLRKGGHFYEANPIARWIFERWNIAGMTAFKFGLVAFIVILCEIIERRRPRVGRAIMLLGCIAALLVIVQGVWLYLGHLA